MLNKFKEYLLSAGVSDQAANVYISQLKSGVKLRNTCKQRGWSTVSKWMGKFILTEVPKIEVKGSNGTGVSPIASPIDTHKLLSVVQSEPVEPIIVHVFSEDTLDDIENILSMQLDDKDKLKIIGTYIQSRQRDLGVKNGTR